jgi:glycosyltransferase involved in cell wall biosynthesis
MVSVLINNYNYGRFVGKAIDSVLAQTYQDYEIIVVDDGSTDDSKEVIQRYVEQYPNKVIGVFKENGGQASAVNAGYQVARGDIIALLDSDDVWYDNKLERIVSLHEQHSFVAHAKHYTDGTKEPKSYMYMNRRKEFLRKYGYYFMCGVTTSVLSFSRELFDKFMPMPEEHYVYGADFYIVAAALYFENLYLSEEELSEYVIHGGNGYFGTDPILQDYERYGQADRKGKQMLIKDLNQYLIKDKRNYLPDFYTEGLRDFVRELEEGFDLIPEGQYVLYGTGKKASVLKEMISGLGCGVYGYADSNQNKWGTEFCGKNILSFDELRKDRNQYERIIISSVWYPQISETLDELGFIKGKDYIYISV